MSVERIKILIVDDEPLVSKMLRAFLEFKGLAVDVASTGSEALEKLGRGGYAAAVVDMRLPDMSGDDVIARAGDISPGTHYFIHTASLDYRLSPRLRGMGIGDEDVLYKPMRDMDDLHNALMKRIGPR